MPTATLPTRQGATHRCLSQEAPRCDSGSGRAPRRACRACGGRLLTSRGYWATFVHSSVSGSARYAQEDAEALFSTEAAADRWRSIQDPDGDFLVVRFVSTGAAA